MQSCLWGIMLNIFTKDGALQTYLAIISHCDHTFRYEPLYQVIVYELTDDKYLQKNQVGYSHSVDGLIRHIEEEGVLGGVVYVNVI